MVVKSNADWELVFGRLKDESKVPLLCDGVRVLLSTGANWKKMKLSILPIVEGVYLPEHLVPLWHYQSYNDDVAAFVRFYQKKTVYAYSAAQREAFKKKLSKKAYDAGRYEWHQYYYDGWDSWPALKKHYSTHFYRVELLESVCDALFERKKQLPGGIGNALPPAMKALPAGEVK